MGLKNLYDKNLLNTILLFVYLLLYNWSLFFKEDGFTFLTLILIAGFTFLFAIALYNLSGILYKLFLVLCILVFIPSYIANEFVGGLNNSHFMAIFLTDFSESTSYVKVIPKILFLKAFLFILPLLYFFNARILRIDYKIALFALAIIVFYSAGKYYHSYDDLKKNKIYTFKVFYISPLRVLVRSAVMYNEVRRELIEQKKLYSNPADWGECSSLPNSDIYVFIIGESVRKDFMGIYNQSMKTTPFLASIPKIQFNQTYSYAYQTVESLSGSFMLNDSLGKPYFPNNIITLTKKAGFDVNWISNQGAIGVEDNFLAAMGKQADYSNFVSKGRWNEHVSDEKMIDVFRERLKQKTDKPQVFFLHMIGSHPDPCDITNGEYKEFVFSENISCYVESIKRTDSFIKSIYQMLKDGKRRFNIIYFSDHGLYLEDKSRVYHRSEYKQNYDVPLIILDSNLKENVYISQNRNLKDFLTFYTQLLNIKTNNFTPAYQFISEEKAPNPFRLYDNKDYRNLKDNPIPQ